MEKKSLYFIGPGEVEVRKEEAKPIGKDEVLVETDFSSISSGTEMLFYKNQIDNDRLIDEEIDDLKENFEYPFKYGYSCVGKVREIGTEVSEEWMNRPVFSFHPHESRFVKSADGLIPVPKGIGSLEASFLPNLETAINIVMDGRPIIGENVIVTGQGEVGLLTTAILDEMPLQNLATVEKYPKRREFSKKFGADSSLEADISPKKFLKKSGMPSSGADLTFEISGDPKALEKAIALTRFEGRIVVGSWYGDKNSGTKLGTGFHRKRLKIISSQVSSINSNLSSCWDKSRRLNFAWQQIKKIELKDLVTHKFSLEEAEKAYSLLDESGDKILHAVFEYK